MKKQEKIKNLYDFDYETQEGKKLKKKKRQMQNLPQRSVKKHLKQKDKPKRRRK